MALFWAKKPKAEKNYDAAPRKAKTASAKAAKAVTPRGGRGTAATKSAEGKEKKAVAAAASSTAAHFTDHAAAIQGPHITEKSGVLSQMGVYTFKISADANKNTVAKAVGLLYKVKPIKVTIINLPSKNVFVKGRRGVVPGTRKALVTLKKGDKIDFV